MQHQQNAIITYKFKTILFKLITGKTNMLSRLRFRRDFRFSIRCLSDRSTDPTDNATKISDETTKNGKTKKIDTASKTNSESATEKIQELLKSMMSGPKFNESEYSDKFTTAPEIIRKRKQKDEIEVTTEKIEEKITKAATDVAQAIGGDLKQTEAELLSKVLGKISQTSTSLSDLLIGMKVDRSKESDDVLQRDTRGQQVKRLVSKSKQLAQTTRYNQRKETKHSATVQSKQKSTTQPTTIDIFSGEPLGIFKAQEPNYGTKLDVWDSLKEREITLATTQPPANYFQKMILWTEQGKVWKFPIDNEQGFEEEQKVHFSEHIFLDTHLEDWCPKKGPVRHFMELVCVGLSKNPFYTVQEKKDHIMWYREYFESKKNLLNEVGAWNIKPNNTEATT